MKSGNPISGLYQYPVACWFVSSCGLLIDGECVATSSFWFSQPIFPMLVSARTCKARSEEAIGFTPGLGCKLRPDIPCTPQERTKRRLYHDNSGLPRACSATSWFINHLGASLDWCIPKERNGFPARSGAQASAHGNGRAACMGQWVASQGAYPQYLGSWWMFVRSHSFETILNLVVYAISFFWCVCVQA